MLGEGGGLCSELATTAARWRPRGRLWARWGHVARGGDSPWRAGGALHSGGENRAKELEEGEKDLNKISEISRDQTVKQR